MVGMGSDEENVLDYFKKIKIVPVSISYEYDPTDALKMPQLMAEANNEIYTKVKNEDFITLLSGIMGQKKRIHIHVGDVLDQEIEEIKKTQDNTNRQIQAVAQAIDESILSTYRLWPTNYIAYDILHNTNQHQHLYSETEKSLFGRRLELKIDATNQAMVESFLAMYSNPVSNQLNYQDANPS